MNTSTFGKLSKEIAVLESDKVVLSKENTDLHRQLDELARKYRTDGVREIGAANANVSSHLDTLNRRALNAEAAVSSLDAALLGARARLRRQRADEGDAHVLPQDEGINLRHQVDHWRGKLELADIANADLRKRLECVTGACQARVEEKGQLMSRLADAHEKLRLVEMRNEQEITILRDNISALEDQLNEAREKGAEDMWAMINLRRDLATARAEVERLKGQLAEARA